MDSAIIKAILGLSLFSILFSIGLSLRVADFRKILRHPKALFVTLFCQIVLLPSFAILVALSFELSGVAALGLLLLAACPGGVTSNLFTRISGGFTALSVSLTVVNSMLAVVTIPTVLFFGQQILGGEASLIHIPLKFLFTQLILITLLPVTLGMLTMHFAQNAAARIERILFPVVSVLFFGLIFYGWYTEFDEYKDSFLKVGLPTITLFLVTCLSAVTISRLTKIARPERIAMVFEVGIQNPPVAFFIAVNILGNTALLPPALVYAVVMTLSALSVVPLFNRFPALP